MNTQARIAYAISLTKELEYAQSIEQFKNSLSERDRRILEMRVEGIKLEDIAKAVGYQTASAAKKRIDKIAEEYERFINPSPDDDVIPDI